jgi:putative ABC transport system permease protein
VKTLFDLDHWQEIWASLAKNRGRTLLTAFGVFWGIFMLVAMVGAGHGLQHGVDAGFAGSATNSFFLWGQRTSKPYRGMLPGRDIQMTDADVKAIRQQVTQAAVVAPRNQLGGFRGANNVTRGSRAGAFSVMGDYPAIAHIQSLKITEGRFLDDFDLDQRRKVAVIGTRVRELLFAPGEEPIDGSIEIDGVYFKVVGLFKSMQTGEDADRDAQTIFVPFTTYQAAFNNGDRVGWFAITSRPGVRVSVVEDAVLKLLRERHRVAPDDLRAFGHFNLQKEFDKVQGLFRGISILVWVVGAGTLAAGVIGVSNIMLIIVKERTREIGLRRAVGATPFAVSLQIVIESIILTSVAGYLGLVAGVAVIEGVRVAMAAAGAHPRMFIDPGVNLADAVKALAILVVSGALAGLIPARRAVAISPVQALRSE